MMDRDKAAMGDARELGIHSRTLFVPQMAVVGGWRHRSGPPAVRRHRAAAVAAAASRGYVALNHCVPPKPSKGGSQGQPEHTAPAGLRVRAEMAGSNVTLSVFRNCAFGCSVVYSARLGLCAGMSRSC